MASIDPFHSAYLSTDPCIYPVIRTAAKFIIGKQNNRLLKVLITAAGLGKRSGLNGHIRKELLPVYDCREGELVLRPMIDVIMHRYRSYGFNDFIVVLSRTDQRTRSYLNEFYPEVEIAFQEKPAGFGDAVRTASSLIEGKFILNCGDGVLISRNDTDNFISTLKSGNFSMVLGLMEVENPSRYGVASVQVDNGYLKVTGVVEKPENPPGNLAIVAVYQLESSIFSEINRIKGDNVELTPAINSLIQSGHRTAAVKVDRQDWLSVGRVQDYRDVLRKSYQHSMPCK